jgi:serine/threonine protein kinase/formylglycine-generating enzyme required for sulfatase activity
MAEASKEGPVILERYQLLHQLGEGGMGAVYFAKHIHLDSKHAVKAMRTAGGMTPDQLKQMEARFLREAKICGMVKHPNLVPVTDFGTTQGVPYIVMDFIDGKDLQHIVDKQGALPEEESLKIIRDVASALGALHDKGIVHRDMKPANVMIEKNTGRVILTDLGIAKDASSSANLTQGIMGTPAFMAPEQVADTKEAGADSDVYSLGATLYTLLRGKPPFGGESALSIIQAAQQNLFAFSSIAGVARERDNAPFPEDVDKLLHDMTSYERSQRIKDMKLVVQRITQILQARSGPAKSSDDITMPFGMEDLASAVSTAPAASGGRPMTGTVNRPPTGGPPAPSEAATVRKAPVMAPPTRPPTAQHEAAPQPAERPSMLVALSDEDAQGGSKGLVAVIVLLVVAALAGGGYVAARKGIVKIPGITPESAGGSAAAVAPAAPGTSTATDGATPAAPGGDDSRASMPRFVDPAKAPAALVVTIPAASDLELVLVKPGSFTIGTPGGDSPAELPAKKIAITYPYYVGRHEVTVDQYAAYLNANPPRATAVKLMDLELMGLVQDGATWKPAEGSARLPIRNVPHLQARRFCEWVSATSGLQVTLPSEVEWEYAARGPKSSVYPWGDDWEIGIACAGEGKTPAPVGSYQDCVSWCGALDMAGNVFEWTADEYVSRRYDALESTDPAAFGDGSSSGARTIRGGCFGNDDYLCRSAYRMGVAGTDSNKGLGFRVRVAATEDVLKHAATAAP